MWWDNSTFTRAVRVNEEFVEWPLLAESGHSIALQK